MSITKQESIATFYSPKFEQQCYLCQHGLHGAEQQAHSSGIIVGEPQVVYSTPEVIVSQTVGQPIPVKRGFTQNNQNNIQNTTQQIEILQPNQMQYNSQLIQTQQIQHNQLKPIEYNNRITQQIPIEQKVIDKATINKSQQISTFYSGKYEEQCYLCQHGLHGKEVVTTQNNVVYQAPEVVMSQTVGQPLTARNTTTVQNFSQIINTPPRNEYLYSQQIQQSPIQNIQLSVPQAQQIISNTTQQLQQSPVQNLQISAQQPQIIPQVSQQNYVFQQIPQVQNYQVITSPQQIVQESVTTIQEQQLSPQEQVENYWRYKVYELQERVYELMNQISLQKQGSLQHQRTGSQVKKSTEDSFKVEQAKQEILQLENQLKIKQKSSIDIRNKLNLMIYRQDPTDEATKYKEQELQQLRQKYNTLNFKHQSNMEDIAMTQAIIEAIKSGKGYKLVSVREQQQTSSYNQSQQYQGQQQYNQVK
ncbi:unnamed protein product (macronuclear) [Paramecium tetraurelia]|uniref:Uncharacterized protein n=1 Tax=Paramecium tetraurelia TaxID=5888 RepID=A0DGK5_PARTE|nr:uncharacterized protein GSPATT00002301001 [Paramecium tetraurelia]CAK82172.1 unnamed protein product [Paramecium tetraurelia]|eukprot:XP_001449569.1 hypothetical protein (macronuclear) [Paramecium tetraurelia strain d4-2]